MHVLDDGRKPFLEFLRNLTPQVALLSLAFFIGSRLNLSEFDRTNWAATLFFFTLIALAVTSVAANSINFMSDYCRSLDALDKAVRLRLSAPTDLRAGGGPSCSCCGPEQHRSAKVGTLRLLGITLAEAWKLKKSLFAELLFTVIAVYGLMFAVFISGVFGGASLLQTAS